MWLLSQAHKNTEYLRNIFFLEDFLFMEEEMLTLHKTPGTFCNNNTSFSVILIKVIRILYAAIVRDYLHIVLEKYHPDMREKEPK